uniref:Ig-like domain-containing protein n=1 Tax=Poecilia mexicana TaxID=48701 RepID=A0A3B3WZ75_9TELE
RGKKRCRRVYLENVSVVCGEDAVFACEVTQASFTVKWAKDGKAIRTSKKYEISQQEKLMKLTIRNVSAEDSGEYSCEVTYLFSVSALCACSCTICCSKNTIDNITTNDHAAQPAIFKQKLEKQEAEEGASVTLQCELSKPGVSVQWKKGTQVLKSGEKYQMKQKASVNELIISKVVPEDSGDYSCVCGDQKTTANLKIKGRRRIYS